MRIATIAKKFFTVGFVLQACIGFAQTPQTPPGSYNQGIKKNYMRTWEATAPESDPALLITRPLRDVKQITGYVDGLGRPFQTVEKQASYNSFNPTGDTSFQPKIADLIRSVVYDDFGRPSVEYMAFAANSTGGNTSLSDGLFKFNPFQQQVSFYNSQLAGEAGETNIGGNQLNWAYGKNVFEASPSNRVQEAFAPGSSWVGTAGQSLESNRHSIKLKYFNNTVADSVRIWNVTNGGVGAWGSYTTGSIYPAGELTKNILIDEHGKQLIVFKNKEGKVILRKQQLSEGVVDNGDGKGHVGWLSTYYIFDDLGLLRCIIQPEGVKLLLPNWTLTPTILDELCFRYEYDERKRLIVKKAPGAVENWMVYDARDRLVMIQDGNLRNDNKWFVSKYDELNRVVEKGMWTNSTSFATHRDNGASSTSYPVTSSDYVMLEITHFDDYTGLPGGLTSTFDNTWSSQFVGTFNTSPLYAQPLIATSQTQGLIGWTQTRVLETADTFIYKVFLYDDDSRPIQVKTVNLTCGTDILTTQFNWAGQPIRSVQKIQKAGSINTHEIVSVTKWSYDDLTRLTKIEKKTGHSAINSGNLSALPFTVMAEYEYDALGQLKRKTIGSKKDPITKEYPVERQPVQELIYDFNVRGWMLGINRDYLTIEGQTDDNKLFGFEIGFDKTTTKAGRNFNGSGLFNGNISGVVWKSDGDDIRRKYDYTYDGANRILKADFEQQNADDHAWNNSKMNFNVVMGDNGTANGNPYDDNGNIKRMQQWGFKLGGNTQIDDLRYSYYNGGNKLKSVTEYGTGVTNHKLGDFTDKNTTDTDYGYDKNGNLVSDLNKRLNGATGVDLASGGAISYNYLNLPKLVQVKDDNGNNKGSITYIYAANGLKLQKKVLELNRNIVINGTTYVTDVTTTTSYIEDGIYESKTYGIGTVNTALGYTDKLQFINNEEGRTRAVYTNASSPQTITGLEYDYLLKDHLGNVRMVVTEEVQQNAYPAASMEDVVDKNNLLDPNNYIPYYENSDYTANSNLRYPISSIADYPTDNYTNPNAYVSKTNGSGQKIGPSVILKVMAGDKFNIHASSWWKDASNPSGVSSPLTDIVSGLISGAPGMSGGKIGPTDLTTTLLNPQVGTFLNNQPYDANIPKAYVNWILFDEQFNYVASSSGAEQVGGNGVFKEFDDLVGLPVHKNGYLYVYVSNETQNINVYFDNLQVTHIRGPLLEESHYYPFGLTMAAISSKAMAFGDPQNSYKFNAGTELSSKEFSDGTGLDIYDTPFRGYDAQIGRFWQIDPLSEISNGWSPYVFCLNNPVFFIDPMGLVSKMPRETSTAEKPKELGNVTVRGVRHKPKPVINYHSATVTPKVVTLSAPKSTLSKVLTDGGSKNFLSAGSGGFLISQPQWYPIIVVGATLYVSWELYRMLREEHSSTISIPLPGYVARDNATYAPPVVLAPEKDTDLPVAVPITPPNSTDPTKVYEIGGWDILSMKWVTLKYGVASTKSDTYWGAGNRRPDSQLEKFRNKYPNLIITQMTLSIFPDKASAHIFENNMVWKYRVAKIRPDPTNPIIGLPPPEQNNLPSGAKQK